MFPLIGSVANAQPAVAPRADWLKWVPGDVKLYVELRDLAGIRNRFRELGIWDAIQQLSTTAPATTQPWRIRAEQSLGLSPDRAIDELLGVRAALFATDVAHWQSGVVIAELSDVADGKALLRRWRARTDGMEGPVQRYVLPDGIGLAVRGRTMLIGPKDDAEGLWERAAALLSDRRGPTLAGRAEFAALRARVQDDCDCLFYLNGSGPGSGDEARAERLLCAADIRPEGIDCEVRGQVRAPTSQPAAWSAADLAALPTGAALVWARSYDEAALRRWLAVDESANSSLVGVFLGLFLGEAPQRLEMTRRLGPRVALVIGDCGASAADAQPCVPPVGIVCESRDSDELIRRLDSSFEMLSAFLSLAAKEPIASESPLVKRRPLAGRELHFADWGPHLVKRFGLSAFRTVQPAWTATDGRIVISTSVTQAESLVAPDRRPNPAALRRFDAGSGEGPVTDYLRVDGRRAARLIDTWDAYLSKSQPEKLDPVWWQSWARQRLEERRRLGIGLKPAPDGTGAVVVEVTAGAPAEGVLEVGDVIVEASGKAVATSQPAAEVAERYRATASGGSFELKIKRGQETRTVAIAVPAVPTFSMDFDPAGTLRRLSSLAARIETLSAIGRMGPGERLDVRLELRWVSQTGGKQ